MSPTVLDAERINVDFGGVAALDDVTMRVAEGSIHGLIGPNGAGKTTLLNVVTRVIDIDGGALRLFGENIERAHPASLAGKGVVRTFQHPHLVEFATVRDNVATGLYATDRTRLWQDALSLRSGLRRERRAAERATEAIEAVGLGPVAGVPVSDLPYGQRKTVELARAWVGRPKLMLLDEPTAGLAEAEIERLQEFLRTIKHQTTVVLVAHHLEFVLALADAVTVLSSGRLVATAPPAEIAKHPEVIAVYTGVRNG